MFTPRSIDLKSNLEGAVEFSVQFGILLLRVVPSKRTAVSERGMVSYRTGIRHLSLCSTRRVGIHAFLLFSPNKCEGVTY